MNIHPSIVFARLAVALALLGPALTGCARMSDERLPQTGDLLTTSEIVNTQGAQTAEVNLRMGAGRLNVSGGAQALMEADFRYNAVEWRPDVDYQLEGASGVLTVRQPTTLNLDTDFTTLRYEWDVRLGGGVPIWLKIDLGAGPSQIDLSQVQIAEFTLGMGAGDTVIDLTGERQNDVVVDVRGGVGTLTLRLPSQVGTIVQVRSGLGRVVTTGLTRQDDSFVNAAYGQTPTTLVVSVTGGVGEINIDVVD